MGLPAKAVAYIELEDYLVLENASRYKHEYLDGVIYAVQGSEVRGDRGIAVRGMAGGSAAHADLIRNIGFALHQQLAGSPCSVKMNEMRLRVEAANSVFYPDVLVHCDTLQHPAQTLELSEARLVVEVLSPSTEKFDRGEKLLSYQQLVGLQHILLVSSQVQQAWVCHRTSATGPWSALTPWVAQSTLALPAVGVELTWSAVYGGIRF